MDDIYRQEELIKGLAAGFHSVGGGAALALVVGFCLWNFFNRTPLRLAGPLALVVGLIFGRFWFLANMPLGRLSLVLLTNYLVCLGGIGLVWLGWRRLKLCREPASYFQEENLPSPAWFWGLGLGFALAALSRPHLDWYSYTLVIFGFQGEGWPLWMAWAVGNLAVFNFLLVLALGFLGFLKWLPYPPAKLWLERLLSGAMMVVGFWLVGHVLSHP